MQWSVPALTAAFLGVILIAPASAQFETDGGRQLCFDMKAKQCEIDFSVCASATSPDYVDRVCRPNHSQCRTRGREQCLQSHPPNRPSGSTWIPSAPSASPQSSNSTDFRNCDNGNYSNGFELSLSPLERRRFVVAKPYSQPGLLRIRVHRFGGGSTTAEINGFKYGPNPMSVTGILEQSRDYSLSVSEAAVILQGTGDRTSNIKVCYSYTSNGVALRERVPEEVERRQSPPAAANAGRPRFDDEDWAAAKRKACEPLVAKGEFPTMSACEKANIPYQVR